MFKGQDAIQKDMNKIKQAHVNLKMLSKAKGKVLHSDQGKSQPKDEGIERFSVKKDWG